jgi:hypothetical protein
MKINTLLSSVVLLTLISSCDLNKSGDEAPATTPATNTTQPAANTTQPAEPAATQQTVPAASQTTVAPPVNVAPGQLSQQQPASSGAVALNPAHGQPGHDCSIPVGQPLKKSGGGVSNGVQVTTTPTQQQQQPITVSAPATQPLSGAKPKINPAHGQPGHRCDIAVGAPLN